MDALEFIKKRNKMCGSMRTCEDCPAFAHNYQCDLGCVSQLAAEEQVAIVEKWSKEHTGKTRQSEFLKQWPGAMTRGGIIMCQPCTIMGCDWRDKNCCNYLDCSECRKEFWLQPVEEA